VEKRKEKTVYFISYCKFLDLLLTTFRLFGGRDVVGIEKKEIYILYINIYVNCIVLLYRCCFAGCGCSGLMVQLLRTQDSILSLPGFLWRLTFVCM
jgi:hypothetical protein